MTRPRISLVLPVHNGADYLGEALASIADQTFAGYELICVDDASSDATPEILAKAAKDDDRITILRNAERRGLPASLNTGFARATGPLHSWVSHDNRLLPHMLERLAALLEDQPDCAIAYGAYREIDPSGAHLGHHGARGSADLLLANTVGAAFLTRAGVWHQLGGYDESLEGVEDYDFWLRARHRFAFCATQEELLEYRLHPASMTTRRSAAIADAHDALLEREIPLEKDAKTRAHAWLALMEQRPDMSRIRYLARAARAHPSTALAHARKTLRWLRAARRN